MIDGMQHVLRRITLDLSWLGIASLAGSLVLLKPGFGVSMLLGLWWLALNFAALTWLLGSITVQKRPSKLFILALVCAKIPASYFILYRLFAADYLERLGLAVGLMMLPLVLIFRGLVRDGKGITRKEG